MGDRKLKRAVAAATPLGSGIGGRSGELDVAGVRVFVKRVPRLFAESRQTPYPAAEIGLALRRSVAVSAGIRSSGTNHVSPFGDVC